MANSQESDYTTPDIDRAVDTLLSRHPAFGAHERFVRERLSELAHRCYQHGRHAGVAELLTSPQVAAHLNIDTSQVRRLAAKHAIGWNVGRDWLFRADDVDALRAVRAAHQPGRPRKAQTT